MGNNPGSSPNGVLLPGPLSKPALDERQEADRKRAAQPEFLQRQAGALPRDAAIKGNFPTGGNASLLLTSELRSDR